MSKVLVKLNIKYSNLVSELQPALNSKFNIESFVVPMPHIEEVCEIECNDLDQNIKMQIFATTVDLVTSK
jgi:hypothetical protein